MKDMLNKTFSIIGEWVRVITGTSGDDYLAKLNRDLVAAGMEDSIPAARLLGEQTLSLIWFPIVWLFIFSMMPFFRFMFEGPKQILFYVGMMAAGFFFPTLRVRDRMKNRQESIRLALPDAADLLTISVEAGLDFMSALKRIVEKLRPGPLREEMERFFRQMELGRSRHDSLKEMSNRVQLDDLSNMCSALIQADRLGSSIAPVLRIQSDVLRTRRMQRAEKRAMEAPIKMMAPLLACIFPAVFIIMFAPLFIQMYMDLTR
jgi:tight adherence protein C